MMTSGKAPAYIGSAKGSEEYFTGGIDDVRIYSRALSADEIKRMALADGKATVDGLVGWWKLDGNVNNSAAKSPKESVAELLGVHRKEITVSKTYLLMPINNGAERNQRISLAVDGRKVRHVQAGLAEKKDDADWWAFFDISAYRGKTLTVSIQPMKEEAFALITQSDNVPGEDKWGSEPNRPQFHFSQKVGWNNDPNGMVYYKGEWHLYFQLNPVFRHNGRDPKPLWYAYGRKDKPLDDAAKKLGGHWVIAIYDHNEKHGRNVAFYTSTDLKKWTVQSHLSGYYECAELFSLPVDGNKEKLRWVVFAAGAKYAIGDFDGKQFRPEHEGKHQLHHGNYYASQLFSDAPDGRRVQIGWAKIPMSGSPFNQTFSFPTELSLRTTKDGVRMFGEPVKEIEKIYGKCLEVAKKSLVPDRPIALETSGALFDIRAEFELGTAKTVGLEVDGKKIAAFDLASGKLNDLMPLRPIDGTIAIRILIDRPMMEIFANHGEQIATLPYENDLNIESVKAFCGDGDAKLVSLKVYQLNARWDN